MVIGMLMVGSGFGLFFASLQRRQTKKEQKDTIAPGHVPTWQYRMKQAGQTVHDSDRPHTLHHNNGGSHDQSDSTATATTSKEGQIMQPAPQRSRVDGSGNSYTKAPSYLDSYEKTEENHRRMKIDGKTEDKNV